MKKFLIIFSILIFMPCGAFAATLKIITEILEPFDSTNPPKTIKTRVVGNYMFDDEKKIEEGSIFEGDVVSIAEPKRGKRDGYFTCKLTTLIKPNAEGDEILPISDEVIVKVRLYKPLDIQDIAISTGATAAGFFVKGITYPINFVYGMADPYDGKGRMASGVQKVYEKSFVSYISKGDAMFLKEGDKVVLVFKFDKE